MYAAAVMVIMFETYYSCIIDTLKVSSVVILPKRFVVLPVFSHALLFLRITELWQLLSHPK